MPVAECQQRISAQEFAEWMAYDMIDPFSGRRADLNAGIIAATVANANRIKGPTPKPADFVPDYEKRFREPVVMSPDMMKRTLASALGVKSERWKK